MVGQALLLTALPCAFPASRECKWCSSEVKGALAVGSQGIPQILHNKPHTSDLFGKTQEAGGKELSRGQAYLGLGGQQQSFLEWGLVGFQAQGLVGSQTQK